MDWKCSGGKCYAVVDMKEDYTYTEAIEICNAYDAFLAKIESKSENDFVLEVCGKNRACWIGLSKPEGSEDWLWQDGSSPVYMNW